MPVAVAWGPVMRERRPMSPAWREVMGGRLMAHIPAVDGSTTFSVPQVVRSRSRTRRRRRKRSWAALWALLLTVTITVIRLWSLHHAVEAARRLTRGRSIQGRKPWHVWPEPI
jgi:hypothetical protein